MRIQNTYIKLGIVVIITIIIAFIAIFAANRFTQTQVTTERRAVEITPADSNFIAPLQEPTKYCEEKDESGVCTFFAVDWSLNHLNVAIDNSKIKFHIIVKELTQKTPIIDIDVTKSNYPPFFKRLNYSECQTVVRGSYPPVDKGIYYTCYQISYPYTRDKSYNCSIKAYYNEKECENTENNCETAPIQSPTPFPSTTPTTTPTPSPAPTGCPVWTVISKIRVNCPGCGCYNEPLCLLTPPPSTPVCKYGNDFKCYGNQCVRRGAERICLTPTPTPVPGP